MFTRNGVLWFVVLLLFEASLARSAQAQNTTLYGITYDGKLVQINVSTVSVSQVRATLPAVTGSDYTGLTLYNNSFQTYTRPSGGATNCDVVSFGPTTGDQIDRGAVTGDNLGCYYPLATSPAGDLETVGFSLYQSKWAWALQTISFYTRRAEAIPNPFYIAHSADFHIGDDASYGLAFANATTAYEVGLYQDYPHFGPHLYELSKSGGIWYKVWDWLPASLSGLAVPMGLVVDPSSSTTLYTVAGYDAYNRVASSTSTLYKISLSSGSPVVTTLGTFTGYSITGLTYGPALSSVSSPGPLSYPPPVRQRQMGSKVFEVIREIIFN
jgi:hypothetical protein